MKVDGEVERIEGGITEKNERGTEGQRDKERDRGRDRGRDNEHVRGKALSERYRNG
jgi:hypothetical protein